MGNKLTKAYPHLAELDNFAMKFAKQIDKIHPAWLGYSRRGEWRDDHYLEISIPAPVENLELIFDTYNHRLTVHFAGWHRHFYTHHGFNFAIHNLLDTAHAVMDEKLIVAVTSRLESVRGRKGKEIVTFGAYTLEQLKQIPTHELVHTASWKGTYDRLYREYHHPLLGDYS